MQNKKFTDVMQIIQKDVRQKRNPKTGRVSRGANRTQWAKRVNGNRCNRNRSMTGKQSKWSAQEIYTEVANCCLVNITREF